MSVRAKLGYSVAYSLVCELLCARDSTGPELHMCQCACVHVHLTSESHGEGPTCSLGLSANASPPQTPAGCTHAPVHPHCGPYLCWVALPSEVGPSTVLLCLKMASPERWRRCDTSPGEVMGEKVEEELGPVSMSNGNGWCCGKAQARRMDALLNCPSEVTFFYLNTGAGY